MTLKEPASNKYWIALGMIQPEWIYMSHFFAEAEEENEEPEPVKPVPPTTKVNFRPRVDR